MKYFLRILALLCFAPLVFAVETKTFNWIPPTQNTDGTALTDAQISSYNIFCNTLLLANVVRVIVANASSHQKNSRSKAGDNKAGND